MAKCLSSTAPTSYKSEMPDFIDIQPTLENYWRSIILFGRNVASYKFALGRSLLEFATRQQEVIALADLAVPFARNLCEHLRTADKQATSTSSKFLDVCRKFNAQEISEAELIDSTTKLGFNNVIDAFHIVHDGEIGVRFFTDERAGKERGIRLTDNVFRLTETIQFDNLPAEIEARWRLVETAWDLKMPRTVLTVSYEDHSGLLITSGRDFERKAITTGQHRFQLIQMEAVSDRVKPITLRVAVYEGEEPVTDIQSVKFESSSSNLDERKKWVSLVLKERQYNKKTPYGMLSPSMKLRESHSLTRMASRS